jgi:DNA-binding cell septation regulator SpoVG
VRITEVKIIPIDTGKTVAYAEITIDNCFRVRDLKIVRRPTGYSIAMPHAKQQNGRDKEIVFGLDPKTRKMIEAAVLSEYEKVAGRRTR